MPATVRKLNTGKNNYGRKGEKKLVKKRREQERLWRVEKEKKMWTEIAAVLSIPGVYAMAS